MLGPLCVWRDGHEVELGPAAQRALLGLLALGCGKPAPRAEIMNAI